VECENLICYDDMLL